MIFVIWLIDTEPLSVTPESLLQLPRNVNSSPPGQNGRHFADNIFKGIFLNENVRISIQFSLKFVAKCTIDNKSTLVQVMAWLQTGDKPLPETMLTQFTDAYMRHFGEVS